LTKKITWSLYGLAILFVLANAYLIYKEFYFLSLVPVALLVMYAALFKIEQLFLFIAFCTPLSVNIETWTDGFGLYLPTEPILFGIMILFIIHQIHKNRLENDIWKNPIIWAVGAHLIWLLFTSLTSSDIMVSFKFMLSRLWFIVPILFFGVHVFRKEKNINIFLWLYSVGLILVVSYTLFQHGREGFSEEAGHEAMWPFFKDHTSYGAILAMVYPIIIGLFFSKKQPPLTVAVLILMFVILTIGLYFSYTRAAWLSLAAAVGVLGLIKFKIKFRTLAIIGAVLGIIVFLSWDQIQMDLAKNDAEHTTEDAGERIQSMTNVSTDASNLERLNRWDCAWQMFKEEPLVGFGPGTYAFQYGKFQHSSNLTIISTNEGNGGNAHSEYLGPLAETGLPGLIIMLCIISAIFYKGIRLYHVLKSKEQRTMLLAMICGLVTYFTHGVLNNYLDTDKASMLVWGFAAAIIALEINHKKSMKEEDHSLSI
jgi:O-antigen ligase